MSLLPRLVLTLTLACLLAACGMRSTYNNLDWLIMRWIDSQVSLDAEQDHTVRQALERKLRWHCASELPRYVALLNQVDDDIDNNRISVERLLHHGETIADLGRDLIEQARPSIIDLLVTLDDEQVEALLDGFDERNQELIEDRIESDPAERRADQVRGMERGLRRFFGRLHAGQRERLEQWALDLRPSAELELAHRLEWQRQFAQALAVRKDPAQFKQTMTPLLMPGALWSDEYRAVMEYNRQQTLQAIADIHRVATDRQITRLRARLGSLAEDFERLTC